MFSNFLLAPLHYRGLQVARHVEDPSRSVRFRVHESIIDRGLEQPNYVANSDIESWLLNTDTAQIKDDLRQYVLSRGFGFIVDDAGGPDMFLHINELKAGIDPDQIRVGDRFTFDTARTRDGKPHGQSTGRAARVHLLHVCYFANGAVITAGFGDPERDAEARKALANAFPSRKIVTLKIDAIAVGGGYSLSYPTNAGLLILPFFERITS